MQSIKVKGRAKINLTLDVVGKRENGYHDVEMVMQQIDLCDDIIVSLREDGAIHLTSSDSFLPIDAKNLAYKAALLMKEEFLIEKGFDIHIQKRIPVAAGLAGGSTDAAATLKAINTLCGLELSTEKLCELGVLLGADVPFCIVGGCALATGLGEVLTPIKGFEHAWMILIKPGFGVSTKDVYQALDYENLPYHPNTMGMIKALAESDKRGILTQLSNVLEVVTTGLHPEIKNIKRYLMDHGAQAVLMSGSGPTVFGFYKDYNRAKHAHKKIKMHYPQSFVATTVNKEGE